MKVLVTGGGGFLGRAIVTLLLNRNDTVRILGRSPQDDLRAMGVEVLQGSITDVQTVTKASRGMDAVIHVAAKAGIWGTWESYYAPNVIGTENVINACKLNHIPKLVYTSTPSVVSQKNDIRKGNEALPYPQKFLCHYAHTKAIAEKKVLQANSPSLKTTALRPHLIWGKKDPHLIPQILKKAAAGKLSIIGNGSNLVDLTQVDNAAWAHILALNALDGAKAPGKAYFISDNNPVQLWPWIQHLLTQLHYPTISKKIPFHLAYFLGGCFEKTYTLLKNQNIPPLTRFIAVQLGKSHYFSIKNAENDLGYAPMIQHEDALESLFLSHPKALLV